MAHHTRRKGLIFGFGTATVVLAMASASFACTNFKGEVRAHTSSFPLLETVAHGVGQAGDMYFCNGDGNPGQPGVQMKGSASGGGGEIFTVSGKGFNCGSAPSFLMQSVNFYLNASPGHWNDLAPTMPGGQGWLNDPANVDCMQGAALPNPPATWAGRGAIRTIGGPYAASGINSVPWGPFTSTLPWKAPVGDAVVCFADPAQQTLDAAPMMNMTFV